MKYLEMRGRVVRGVRLPCAVRQGHIVTTTERVQHYAQCIKQGERIGCGRVEGIFQPLRRTHAGEDEAEESHGDSDQLFIHGIRVILCMRGATKGRRARPDRGVRVDRRSRSVWRELPTRMPAWMRALSIAYGH